MQPKQAALRTSCPRSQKKSSETASTSIPRQAHIHILRAPPRVSHAPASNEEARRRNSRQRKRRQRWTRASERARAGEKSRCIRQAPRSREMPSAREESAEGGKMPVTPRLYTPAAAVQCARAEGKR